MKTKTFLIGASLLLAVGCTTKKSGVDAILGPENMYEGQVIQIGGIGSHTTTKSAWSGPNSTDSANFDATNLVITGFNTPGDLMWVSCAQGFSITKCESSTENNVTQNENFGCGLALENKLQNIVEIECVRSE